MPLPITAYRVFIASPGGLQEERKIFREVVNSYNEVDAVQRGLLFIPTGWEDTLGGVGRPQAIINEDLRVCDYFILLLWDRWGTPPDVGAVGGYSSGTQEEYTVAQSCLLDSALPMREIVAFFKAVDPSKLSDPGEQLQKVLDFKRELERQKMMLFSTFDNSAGFTHQLRRHLAKWVRDHEREKAGRPSDGPARRVTEPPIPPLSSPAPSAATEASSGRQLLERAEWLANSGHITDAETLFARATAKGDDPIAFIRYGIFLTRLGRVSQAQVMYERVRELAGSGEESIHRLRGELDESERMILQSLAIHERMNNQEEIANDLGKLGLVVWSRGLFDQAEESLRKSLEIKMSNEEERAPDLRVP